MQVVFDTETNALKNYSRLWCIVCIDVATETKYIFREPDLKKGEFRKFAEKVTLWIGHNIIEFDLEVLHFFFGLADLKIKDTLVLSRLIHTNIEGGHALEAWGERLGYPKDLFDDFSQFSERLVSRCVRDAEINLKLWHKYKKYDLSPRWRQAIEIEHDTAILCRTMTNNGFYFDVSKAKNLFSEIAGHIEAIDKELLVGFKPKSECIGVVEPKATKYGTISLVNFKWLEGNDLTPFTVGAPFSRFRYRKFNPRSTRQLIDELHEAKWKPTEKTKGHLKALKDKNKSKLEHYKKYGWTISEKNLETLPRTAPPALKLLTKRLILESRRSDLEEWIALYSEESKRIHGRFFSIGAWTHRMAHHSPNTANIASPVYVNGVVAWGLEGAYGADMRTLWSCPEDRVLVGVDADGIQLRVLAHLMNDSEFTDALVRGDKSKGTDAHSLNKEALGPVCRDRDTAKTFIFAWLLGAGTALIASILECTQKEAKEAQERFLSRYKGLRLLKTEKIPADARRGCFEGLDNRLILCNNEHKMLAGYLQNGETVVMKKAASLWTKQLNQEQIPYKLINFVHDEWITETLNEVAEYVKKVQCESIRIAGELLGTKCPMLGQGKIGKNWYEIH